MSALTTLLADITSAFSLAFRQYVTDGVSASGKQKPAKADLRALGATIASKVGQGVQELNSVVVTLADDTATSLLFSTYCGTARIAMVQITGLTSDTSGLVWAKAAAGGAATAKQSGGANFLVTTGALAGTTFTDAKFNVSAHTDEMLYLENRTGASATVRVTFLGYVQ